MRRSISSTSPNGLGLEYLKLARRQGQASLGRDLPAISAAR